MYRVLFSAEADDQLIRLYDYIATAASPDIAEHYIEAIVQHCESLATFPMRGQGRDDIRPGLRVFGFRRRVSIAFAIAETTVTILGVFYGGQRFEAAFEENAE